MHKVSIFVLAVAMAALVACKENEEAKAPQWAEATPGLQENLTWAAMVLAEHDCLTQKHVDTLKMAIKEGDLAAFGLAVTDLDGACDAGTAVLTSIAQTGTTPAFDDKGLVFDADGDGCLDSTYRYVEDEVFSRDADDDGCQDRLLQFEVALARLDVPEELRAELQERVVEIYYHLVPPVWWTEEPAEEIDWQTRRAQAEPLLDALIADLAEAGLSKENQAIAEQYLENTRPLVADYVAWGPSPPREALQDITFEPETEAGKADELICTEPESVQDQRWFCIYTNSAWVDESGNILPGRHAFIGLIHGDDRFLRGMELYGYSGKYDVPRAPDADQVNGDGSAEEASKNDKITPDNWGLSNDNIPFGSGAIRDDSGTDWNARICWPITAEQWDLVAAKINEDAADPPAYNVFGDAAGLLMPFTLTMNCVTWATSFLDLLGLDMPLFTTGEQAFTPFHLYGAIASKQMLDPNGCISTVVQEPKSTCGNGIIEHWQGESCDDNSGADWDPKPCWTYQFKAGGGWQKVEGDCIDCRCQAGYLNAPEGSDITISSRGCVKDKDCTDPAPQCFVWKCVPDTFDPNQAGSQSSKRGICVLAPIGLSYTQGVLACDDGDPCTMPDECKLGMCIGTPPCGNGVLQPDCQEACDPPGSPCTAMGTTGECSEACACRVAHDDLGEHEFAGCKTTADCPPMTLPECWKVWCNFETHICEATPKKIASDCEDGDKCTYQDLCDIVGGTPKCVGLKVPCDDGNPCTIDSCDPATGGCVHEIDPELDTDEDGHCNELDNCPFVANDQTDTDGDGIGDACECEYADCPLEETQCQLACNPETGECPFKPDYTDCDDGVLCTKDDFCLQGVCKGGDIDMYASCCTKNEDCDDGNICTNDWCEKSENKCVNEVLGILSPKPIEDGDPCTVDEVCDKGVLVPGSILTCSPDLNPCTYDTCKTNPETGDADCHLPLPKGFPCEDGDLCTVGDYCTGPPDPKCFSGLELECDDDFFCTLDTCESGECEHLPMEGCCQTDEECDDGDDCTEDTCDPESDECSQAEVNCNDNDACTTDGCDAATGCFHLELGCDDNDACTTDGCDDATGCFHSELGCDDNDACTTDGCDMATGCYHVALGCDDNDACTTDGCDIATGCFHVPVFGCCTEDNPGLCGEGETCQCVPGFPCTCVPIPTGACCIGGQCQNGKSEETCGAGGGSYQGDGVACKGLQCAPEKSCAAGGNIIDCLSAFETYTLSLTDNKGIIGFEGEGLAQLLLMGETVTGPGAILGAQVYLVDVDESCAAPVDASFQGPPDAWEVAISFQAEAGAPAAIELEFDPTLLDPLGADSVIVMLFNAACE